MSWINIRQVFLLFSKLWPHSRKPFLPSRNFSIQNSLLKLFQIKNKVAHRGQEIKNCSEGKSFNKLSWFRHEAAEKAARGTANIWYKKAGKVPILWWWHFRLSFHFLFILRDIKNICKNYISVAQLTSHFLINVSLSQNLQPVHTKAKKFAGHNGDFRLWILSRMHHKPQPGF